MSDNYDQLALSWVRKEINNTLEQARQGLERFAEDSQDQTQIQFCINCLHQVQGTLQMLDFSGAAKLAFEMERLAEKMSNDSNYAIDSAFEILMRALLQMPGYLERVEDGHKDIPVILLPLINQIRSASNLAPLSERDVFSAEIANVTPPKALEDASEEDKTSALQDNAKKLRAHYQKGLTSVIRGENIKDSLGRIHKVLLRLEALTEGWPIAKLCWVADGFIFSITEKGLYKKKEIHQLLGQVDKFIGGLSEQGPAVLEQSVPEDLLSQLLYYVARSNSTNARVVSLKQEFKLEDRLADSAAIKKRQEKLAQPDVSAVTNVAGALNEELASVKDLLDLFVRSSVKDKSQLQTLVDSLNRIADTLTLLELAIPRDVIKQQTSQIQKMIDKDQLPGDGMIMDIAGALLFVEANLKNINLDAFNEKEESTDSDANLISQEHAKDAQVDDATQALIKVARKSMQGAKDNIIGYIAAGLDKTLLIDVPDLLDEVLGAVKIIQFDKAGEILQVAKDYVELQASSETNKANSDQLDALADVITSVEYYLEASEEGKLRGIESILKGAEQSLTMLIDVLEASKLQAANPQPIDTISTHEEDRQNAVNPTEMPAIEAMQPEPTVENKPALTAATKQVDESLIDEEVLEIFLEEAEEEIESLAEMLPRWINDVKDQEALSTLRRSFHTLKGSGRLVGASVIGDLSWAVENMLNKVIEDTIPAESPVTSLLSETQMMLPRLVENFAKQTSADDSYKMLIAKAEHISAGKPIGEFSYSSSTEQAADTKTSSGASAQEEAIDPLLLEIFSTEADSHLAAINAYLTQAPTEGSVAVTDELIRALHTLKGSARMANVQALAGLTGPWEKYARLVKGSGQRFKQDTVGLLSQSADFLVESLQALKSAQAIDWDKEKALIDALAELPSPGANNDKASSQQRDQRLVSIFLTEGLDILQEVSQLNQALSVDLNDKSKQQAIENELDAFYLGAEMLSIKELEQLSAASKTLIAEAAKSDALDISFTALMHEVLEDLTAMLNRIASEEDLDSPDALVLKIASWINTHSATADLEIADQAATEVEPKIVLEAENTSEILPEDMDEELVELFVEEGEELIETARELLERWYDNLQSKELHSELRRIYHTIKGSSRMAGAMAIGDLGHAAEDIFNTVLDFGRKVELQDHLITTETTDKLETMIAELKTLRWPAAASEHVSKIRRHLAGESESEVEPELESTESEIEETELLDIPVVSETISEVELPKAETDAEENNSFDAPEAFEPETIILEPVESSAVEIDSEEYAITEEIEQADQEPFEQELEDNIPVAVEQVSLEQTSDDLMHVSEQNIEIDLPASGDLQAEQEPEQLEGSEELSLEEIQSDLEDEVAQSHDEVIELENLQDELESTNFEPVTDKVATPPLQAKELDVSETISPSAPVVVSGGVHQISLDEDGEEVLDIYLEEAEELLIALDDALHDWADDLSNKNAIDLLQRTLHTFKGGARLSDLVILGDLTHEMETYFERVNSGQIDAKASDVDFMLKGYDVIAGLVNEVETKRQMTIPAAYMHSLKALIKGEAAQIVEEHASEPTTGAQIANESTADNNLSEPADRALTNIETNNDDVIGDDVVSGEVVSFEEKKQQADNKQKQAKATDIIRVPAEQLEELVNLAGETSIFRSRLEQQMSVLRYNLEEMSATVERLRDQLRNLDIETDAQISYRKEISGGMEYEDFDPLEMDRYTRQQELTRGLSESAVDLVSLKESLDTLTADSETLLLQQGRVNTEMQESLMRTRMIPFESLVPRLRRMVRQISSELGKTIELSINADGEMDRSVLERLIAPLEHMLRNAMDHGIESETERKAANKRATGNIKIALYREGSEVFVKIQDDGRGLNLSAIRAKAIERGLINEDSELSDHELQQLILEAGFSTAQQVTQISGRGVGMDVVSSEIKQLGGVIEIDSVQGAGSTFTIKLPFTVSVNHALMVQLGEEVFAIPLANIEGIVRVSPFELEEYYNNPESNFEYAGVGYSMYALNQLLDHSKGANLKGVTQALPVLLLHGADHPTALQVDGLLGSREVVVKSIGSQLSSISGLSGATILGDGRVVLILDLPALIRRIDANIIEAGEENAIKQVEVAEEKVKQVMVVDDSITVRKVTSRLLERNDYEVITAKDGIDALSVLGEHKPDVMLLDIEMPRMDGFELATIIRHDEELKDLPIIMITSRTGDKHRERAMQIGVDRYLGKPYNEVDLLETISELTDSKV
jgi:chemosensory pili system protein ChpA (sensor histidine kinase/response regulator)